jgi:hypothetical protein
MRTQMCFGCARLYSYYTLKDARTSYIRFEKYGKVYSAIYILARLFAILRSRVVERKATHRSLIPQEILQKFIRILSGACSANWHLLSLMYAFRSFLLDSHRAAAIDTRERWKCSLLAEMKFEWLFYFISLKITFYTFLKIYLSIFYNIYTDFIQRLTWLWLLWSS